MPVSQPSGTSPRATAAALALTIAASVALCGWYSSHRPDRGRWWDERFSVDNVRTVLVTGSPRPTNGYYQSLSYLPQAAVLAASQALHRWTGAEALAVLDQDDRFTATGYLLSRWLQVAYGAACLLLTFAIGRRIFSPAAGLLGAVLLAVTPWHVQASSIFKPDVLLALAVLLTVRWSLGAAERPTLPRFALAGCGVGLALSTKLTGGVAAVVPALAAVLAAGGAGRKALRLVTAGAAALALFAALNPWFFSYGRYLDRNLAHYTRKAASYGGTRLGVLVEGLAFPFGDGAHGLPVGTLAALGAAALTAGLAAGLWRRRGDRRERVRLALLLAFPVVYPLAYAAATPHFKGNNFVVVLPFTALLAAWTLIRLWTLARDRLPALRRRLAWALPAAALAVALLPAPWLHVYREVVPPTLEQARAFLAERLEQTAPGAEPRVYAEEATRPPKGPPRRPFDWPRIAVERVERLDAVPEAALDRADGEVFPAHRLDGEGSEFYLRRIARADPESVRRSAPRWFVARGPEIVAVAHPPPQSAPPQSAPPASWRKNRP